MLLIGKIVRSYECYCCVQSPIDVIDGASRRTVSETGAENAGAGFAATVAPWHKVKIAALHEVCDFGPRADLPVGPSDSDSQRKCSSSFSARSFGRSSSVRSRWEGKKWVDGHRSGRHTRGLTCSIAPSAPSSIILGWPARHSRCTLWVVVWISSYNFSATTVHSGPYTIPLADGM